MQQKKESKKPYTIILKKPAPEPAKKRPNPNRVAFINRLKKSS